LDHPRLHRPEIAGNVIATRSEATLHFRGIANTHCCGVGTNAAVILRQLDYTPEQEIAENCDVAATSGNMFYATKSPGRLLKKCNRSHDAATTPEPVALHHAGNGAHRPEDGRNALGSPSAKEGSGPDLADAAGRHTASSGAEPQRPPLAPRSWWHQPSPWAPQTGFRVFSRADDWALLAAAEGDGSAERAARLIGVTALQAERRMFALVGEMAGKHWRRGGAGVG